MPRLIAALALALAAASPAAPARPWLQSAALPPLPQTAVARTAARETDRQYLLDRIAATIARQPPQHPYYLPQTFAEAGDTDTPYRLGQYHSQQGDHQTAQAWFRKAAAQGDQRAYIALALYRLAPLQKINNGAYNSTLTEEYDAASAWLELAINTNRSAVAEYWRGCINHKRNPDADSARTYWYAAAAQNHLPAMLNLQRPNNPKWLTRAIRTDTWQNTYTAAIRGDAAAQYRLGQTYARGDGVRPDPDEARKWLAKAAAQQLPDAQTALAILAWQNGDTESARENLNRAAAANHPDARYWLGQLAHAQGDETAATAHWQRAAAQNHAGAMRELGNQQARRGDQQNARDWWQRAAETHPPDAQAMYHLGQSLLGENRDAARRWWQQASEHGHGWAFWYLASSYAVPDALGLPQNGAQAWQYARRAADQGNRDAAKLLMALAAASCGTSHAYAHPQSPHDQPINHWHARYQDETYWRQAARIAPLASLPASARPANTTPPPQRLIPDPLPQEYRAAETAAHTVAARYWQHHAAAGDAEAQYQLGQHYALGAGVPLDPDTARAWYTQAAKQEHARAQTALGLLAQNGQTKPYTVADGARYWWEKAAAQGESNAQNWLGQIAAKAKNDSLAQDWYRRAAAGGNPIAMRHLADSYRDRYSDADHSAALGHYWQTQAVQGHHPNPETLYRLGARDRNSGSYAAPATPQKKTGQGR